MKAANLANGNPKDKRRELDFYPTPPEVTEALMLFLNLPPCVVWEPACGDGAMSRVIERHGHAVVSTDLRHSEYGVGGIDFLTADIGCDAIITNPPFLISAAFITHALKQAPTVAMLLKSQYWHAAGRKELFDTNRPAFVLPLTWRPDFMGGERGGSPTMEVCWTVWLRGETDTRYRPLSRPRHVTVDTTVNID